jgi:P27 family predicted phage terminase small subunit
MRGRKPKPTALKVLSGNPGKRPLPTEPELVRAIPRCPRHLDGEARREWRRIAGELYEAGLLTRVDRAALAAYCQAWARWVEAEEKVRELGAVVKTPTGCLMQNPWLGVANRALDEMRRFLVEFGMTPSSRTRVKVESPNEPDLADVLFSGIVAEDE